MQKGEIIRYVDMTIAEGINLQRGMNYNIPGKPYHIILMSVRPNAPYADEWVDDSIIYEGHDIQKNHNQTGLPCDQVDQPMYNPSGTLTENGKFYQAAQRYKQKGEKAELIKVYEKIKDGIWVYNGYFELVDAWSQSSGNRTVFKFKLQMIESTESEARALDTSELEMEHNRLIPTAVKALVWARDKGKCVKCGSNKNLHYDHIIPFSKGGSSKDPNNIQLLGQKCNLKKHDKIE